MIRHAPSIGIGIGISLGSGGALEPYPLAGRVLDLGTFNYTLSEVPDLSPEDNDAVLYSARGANLAGADYVELPDVGATKSITFLARSSTDTTIYATDDAGQTEDASATITADGTWQEVTLTFTNAISGEIRLGSDGTSFFSGDLADAKCYDASGVLLDQFYLNEHTDTAAAGLDGLPVIGRNGNIGQYVNCAAVVQIAGDVGGLTPPQVLGMDFNQYRWFNGVDTRVSFTKVDFSTGDWSVGATVVPFDDSVIPVIGDGIYWTMQVINFRTALNVRTNLGGTLYTITLDSELTLGQKYVLTVSRAGNTLSAEVNGVTQADTATCGASDTFAADAIGNRSSFYAETLIFNVNINNQVAYLGYGETPWDDTIGSNDGTESGSFENVLVPESLTKGTDSLGNAIESPRTNKTFNADGSGYGLVPDDDSLDLTTEATWVFKGNFYGVPVAGEPFLTKSDGATSQRAWIFTKTNATNADQIRFLLSSSGTSFNFIGRIESIPDADAVVVVTFNAGTLLAYVDGSPVAITTETGSIPASIFVTTAPIAICSDISLTTTNTPISDVKIYNRELTAEEVAKFS